MGDVFMRGVADPVRRLRHRDWWRKYPSSLLLSPDCAAMIYSAKFAHRVEKSLEFWRA